MPAACDWEEWGKWGHGEMGEMGKMGGNGGEQGKFFCDQVHRGKQSPQRPLGTAVAQVCHFLLLTASVRWGILKRGGGGSGLHAPAK